MVDGTGHNPHQQSPDAVAELVIQWLKKYVGTQSKPDNDDAMTVAASVGRSRNRNRIDGARCTHTAKTQHAIQHMQQEEA